MTPARRERVVSMPTKTPESPLEITYNSAVQSFVRRDHAATHSSLGRLLGLARSLPRSDSQWFEIRINAKDEEVDAQTWRYRILKLLVSAYASLYSDPPQRHDALPIDLTRCLPPASPELMLQHALEICHDTLDDPSLPTSAGGPIPPQLLSTLVLAALKLQPAAPALEFARRTTEAWLADLPHSWLASLSSRPRSGSLNAALNDSQQERNRESYLKVLELFVGEVLAREGEFEMARAFLDGDEVLGSKRKEALYRQLRSVENHTKTSTKSTTELPPPQSPSASLVLPTPSSSRSRRSSASSSSSERTARPKSVAVGPVSSNQSNGNRTVYAKDKGKSKAVNGKTDRDADGQSVQSNSTVPLPKKIHVNPPSDRPLRRTAASDMRRQVGSLLDLLPTSLRDKITSPLFVLSYIIPVPLVLALLVIWWRRRSRGGQAAAALVAAVGATSDVRQKLDEVTRRAGGRGLRAWFVYWLRWWLAKFAGMWRMGTTLTYL